MGDAKKDIWFPAKTYGWGWGAPVAWQGWVVILAYLGLLLGGAVLLLPRLGNMGFLAYVFVITVILFAICWNKGETPRWRWGK